MGSCAPQVALLPPRSCASHWERKRVWGALRDSSSKKPEPSSRISPGSSFPWHLASTQAQTELGVSTLPCSSPASRSPLQPLAKNARFNPAKQEPCELLDAVSILGPWEGVTLIRDGGGRAKDLGRGDCLVSAKTVLYGCYTCTWTLEKWAGSRQSVLVLPPTCMVSEPLSEPGSCPSGRSPETWLRVTRHLIS